MWAPGRFRGSVGTRGISHGGIRRGVLWVLGGSVPGVGAPWMGGTGSWALQGEALNWCSYTVTRTVSCHVQNGTFLQRVFQGCRWPLACSGGSYRAVVRPLYRVTYRTLTALEWRCCPGHAGQNCEEALNPPPKSPTAPSPILGVPVEGLGTILGTLPTSPPHGRVPVPCPQWRQWLGATQQGRGVWSWGVPKPLPVSPTADTRAARVALGTLWGHWARPPPGRCHRVPVALTVSPLSPGGPAAPGAPALPCVGTRWGHQRWGDTGGLSPALSHPPALTSGPGGPGGPTGPGGPGGPARTGVTRLSPAPKHRGVTKDRGDTLTHRPRGPRVPPGGGLGPFGVPVSPPGVAWAHLGCSPPDPCLCPQGEGLHQLREALKILAERVLILETMIGLYGE
uniref:EMI domain-containing protein n=1 Tax=Junco hyemalis TaxID=40217 RepID=A0A8C5IQY7_JUNHY